MIEREWQRPVAAPVAALAAGLAARAGSATAGVLFYGSALRDAELDGVLDFYVLVDRAADWPGSRAAALANRVLPPRVGYVEHAIGGRTLRAKYAVMTLDQFAHAMSPARIDTTLWARFSQPCACVLARSPVEREQMRHAVAGAVVTAAHWAAVLGPREGEPLAYWRALFARTYATELRVERTSRGVDLVASDAARYAELLPAAWQAAGIAFDVAAAGALAPRLGDAERRAAERRWQRRQRLGRPLNLLRLLKAATTFDNAIDYVAWKVERHSGYRIEPSAFQRRHPLLAAPLLYARLRRRGVLR
ncbi:hypothetical protein HQN59_05600 [Schlegelella sp. ID0723]|uniref:Phosphatidate cytidylyltransferase n=1 Tax=Piscinibacter koreensis TaxID=2742824 RepID=A0A7Y6NL60_9BURK|nr:hypothetical protein [Schlegelella koreensis]